MSIPTFSNLSKQLTSQLDKKEKKKDGIFFTPPKTVHKTLEFLEPYMSKVSSILEPSCGSCEYILPLHQKYPTKQITGIEYNKTIFNSIQELELGETQLIQEDFLKYKTDNLFDLVIGNPPFYVMNKKGIDKEFVKYFEGRPNIYIIFILKSLKLLKPDGLLSFILPRNFLTCSYYDKTRQYIEDKFTILTIQSCQDKYLETQQKTILLVVQNRKSKPSKFSLTIGNHFILGLPTELKKLKQILENSTTLQKLNFNVGVGNVVWNQYKEPEKSKYKHKHSLTNDASQTRIIYSSDIKNGELIFSKFREGSERTHYIDKPGTQELQLLVNRGYGNGKYSFDFCLMDVDFDYLVENHLIYIKCSEDIDRTLLKEKYKKIMKSLKDPRTEKFVSLYFGNNAINTVELAEILPIYGFET